MPARRCGSARSSHTARPRISIAPAGSTRLEVLTAFESASGLRIPVRHGPRRAGDVPAVWADASLARRLLGWEAGRTLEEACRDAMRWRRWWSEYLRPGGTETAVAA